MTSWPTTGTVAPRPIETAPSRTRRPTTQHVPDHRRSSMNEDWWIDDDGAWTDGRDCIAPSPETAAAWRTATAARRRARASAGHRARRAA